MFFAGRFTLSQSSPATYLRNFFLEFICVFREILSTSVFFCCSMYTETAQNSREESNEFMDLLFWRLSLCLSRDSLICDTRLLDFIQILLIIHIVFYSSLYFYTSNTFRAILAPFSHILLYTNFFLVYITMRNIFLIPDNAVARNLIIIFNSAVKGLI